MRRGALLLLLTGMAIVAACQTASFDVVIAPATPTVTETPTPTATLTPPVTPEPTPSAIPPSTKVTLNLCQSVRYTVAGNIDVVAANEIAMPDGTAVIFHQSQGHESPGADTSGTWELAVVAANTASGSNVVLSFATPLSNAYRSDAKVRAQVCRVPYFSTLTLGNGGFLEAGDWDGARGGILALRADQIVMASASQIRAVGSGFRGGISQEGSGAELSRAITSTDTPGVAGAKGEGEDPALYGKYARGPALRGGGGGHRLNSGGGGGGSKYQGGNGASATHGGLGGEATGAGTARFGGGGGGGQGDASTDAGDGGGGGGFLFVEAGTISVTNPAVARISVDGGGGASCSVAGNNGGGGGGGGGGSLWFTAGHCVGDGLLFLEARGGGGGPCDSNVGSFGGGGGGGGDILLALCTTSTAITLTLSDNGGPGNDGGEPAASSDDGGAGASD